MSLSQLRFRSLAPRLRCSLHECYALRVAALTCGVLLVLATPSFATDRVVLKDGKTLEGRVVFENDKRVVVRVGSKDRDVATSDVSDVRSVARSVREIVARWEKLAPDDAAGRMDLAQLAKGRELTGEADVLAWSVLAVDASNEAAHTFLHHEKKGDRWMVKDGLRTLPYDKFVEMHGDFSDAWRLATTHFALRTNEALDVACNTLLELELFYVSFLGWFTPQLELYEIDEPVTVQMHADRKSYPGGSGRKSYFDPASNSVFLNMSEGVSPDLLIREATHALLNATSARTKDARGTVPPWLAEGLADYFSVCRSGKYGHPVYTPGAVARSFFALHAGMAKPNGLSRILALASDDFLLSANPTSFYAQSYTLVHYCLHGEDGKYRVRFQEYLKGCFNGRSSATDFKSALVIQDERVFEAGWLAYAKRNK